jgi:hydrogenase large subunit
VRAVEDALKIKIPDNANIIRNMMQLTLQVHDHLVHFYHLHALDWVDVVSGAEGRPEEDQRAGAEHQQLARCPAPATSATCRTG